MMDILKLNIIRKISILPLVFFLIIPEFLYSKGHEIFARVESIRKDNFITLLFHDLPVKEIYYLIDNKIIFGKIKIINVNINIIDDNKVYKVLAEYFLNKKVDKKLLMTGSLVGLLKGKSDEDKDFGKPVFKEKTEYKKWVISPKDKRVMILVPGGKFIFGSNNGDRDEYPEQIVSIGSFYIDKNEVSNRDFLKFIKETKSSPPLLWRNGIYKKSEGDLPVVTSYYLAERYSRWAGKRLPTEKEWEKAVRGSGIEMLKGEDEIFTFIQKPIIYPWGNKFNPGVVNSIEFWDSEKVGGDIKKRYKKGLLPVNTFDCPGCSPYGIVNMCGNAMEWTSSWYQAYPGNKYSNKRYGKQVKVVRGGSWYSNRYRVRVTSREYGGIPNLYDDNIAGFRCVKEPVLLNRLSVSN